MADNQKPRKEDNPYESRPGIRPLSELSDLEREADLYKGKRGYDLCSQTLKRLADTHIENTYSERTETSAPEIVDTHVRVSQTVYDPATGNFFITPDAARDYAADKPYTPKTKGRSYDGKKHKKVKSH